MASSGLSIKINTSNLDRKLKNWKQNLISVLRSEWTQIVMECLEDIASRAPYPAVEYTFLVGGPYPEITPIPPDKGGGWYNQSRPSFPMAGERVNFNRSPGYWLKDAVKLPGTWSVDLSNFKINLGVVSALEEATRFSWTNFSRKSGAYPHTSEYGVWSFFEYGKTNVVRPRNWSGDPYKLKPEGSHWKDPSWAWEMTKSYPAMGMYSDFNRSVLTNAIATRIRAVKY